ncbi:hypothetical protein CRG98_003218 [Punica granatum]|uniref:Uncharacterized protein n=1 Tax=Punica granatum TaxID=22663 RepID=A0A2I0L703_PUNGR|nr:hypothetical protein CRG98_003218 [Punica granatum]
MSDPSPDSGEQEIRIKYNVRLRVKLLAKPMIYQLLLSGQSHNLREGNDDAEESTKEVLNRAVLPQDGAFCLIWSNGRRKGISNDIVLAPKKRGKTGQGASGELPQVGRTCGEEISINGREARESESESENGIRTEGENGFVLRRSCHGVVHRPLHPPQRLQGRPPIRLPSDERTPRFTGQTNCSSGEVEAS